MNRVSNGWDNGLSPIWRKAIIPTNVGLLSMGPLGTNFSEIWIEIRNSSFMKMHLNMSFAKWQPFCTRQHELYNAVIWRTLSHWSGLQWNEPSDITKYRWSGEYVFCCPPTQNDKITVDLWMTLNDLWQKPDSRSFVVFVFSTWARCWTNSRFVDYLVAIWRHCNVLRFLSTLAPRNLKELITKSLLGRQMFGEN